MSSPTRDAEARVRIIAHLDMDAFYAAVEEHEHPELRGRPLVVGADPKAGQGRGVVTTANYAARKHGIWSAMPISRAWRLAEAARRRGAPEVVFIRGTHALYRAVSARIMAIARQGADLFEAASIDEAYLDVSSLEDFAKAAAHVTVLKADILRTEGLTCSVGIGPNKLVAKIASDFRKPDGLTVVRPAEVEAFLAPLGVRVIPGIGPKTEAVLRARGIQTVASLRLIEAAVLREWFGKWGENLYERARGISADPVSDEWERKSVGEQETFEEDTLDVAFLSERARALAAGVFQRFAAERFRAFHTVTLTVRFAGFLTVSRSRTSKTALTVEAELQDQVRRLLLPFFDARENPRRKGIRLIGVRVERLVRDPGGRDRQADLALDPRPTRAAHGADVPSRP